MSKFTNFCFDAIAFLAWGGFALILLVVCVVLAPIFFLTEIGTIFDPESPENYYHRY